MNIVTLDFETEFDDFFSLSKLTTENYVRDERFKALGCALKMRPDLPTKWWPHNELPHVFADIAWHEHAVLCHHTNFDGLILTHHYNVKPKFWFDTLSCARLLLGNHLSVSLANLAQHFNLAAKNVPYNLFKGKSWDELTPGTQQQIADGCCHDVELTWRLFEILAKNFPREEFTCIDLTIRMFCEPKLRADVNKLAQIWESEAASKQKRLDALAIKPEELQSAAKFTELLRAEGIEPEMKSGKKGPIPAFAKSDPFMVSLLENEDERIRTLAEARIGAKSTLLQTRAEHLGFASTRGPLPMYLHYAGAHTSRWSGGDGNPQNMTPALNACILPPEGFDLVKPDAAQVECRLLNYIAGQEDKIQQFRDGKDPYVDVAAAFCGHPVNKIDHPELRQCGKIVELQAGFGSGGPKIRNTLRVKAGIIITDEEGERYKVAYRQTHPMVEQLWKTGGRMLARLAGGDPIEWGPTLIKDHKIILPNGIPLNYDTLEFYKPTEADEIQNEYDAKGYWRLQTRRGWVKMYGAKLVENCLSAQTKVFTRKGWTSIIDVLPGEEVWDGISWVRQDGCGFRGINEVAALNGVKMTSNHKVLTQYGWLWASQAKGLRQAKVWIPNGFERCWNERTKAFMGFTLRMWKRNHKTDKRISSKPIMRVQEKRADRKKARNAWNVFASCVGNLALHARSLSFAVSSRVEKLWRPWNKSLQALGEFRVLLEGYGSYISNGFNSRTQEKSFRVFASKLHLGKLPTASKKSSNQSDHSNAVGSDECCRRIQTFGDWSNHSSLSPWKWLAKKKLVHTTKLYEPTYDLLNCGPRNQFVVLGDSGPFIVHNCVQALARLLVSQAMIRISRLGYAIVNMRHDDLWVLIPKDGNEEKHKQILIDEMRRVPTWLPGIPLDAEIH